MFNFGYRLKKKKFFVIKKFFLEEVGGVCDVHIFSSTYLRLGIMILFGTADLGYLQICDDLWLRYDRRLVTAG